MLVSRLTDVLGELGLSVLDLPARYDDLGAAARARVSLDFEAIGLKLKSVFVTAISVPPEVEKAIDERASMGAIGNMQAYLQFKAARALGDAALNPGGGESMAGLGVGLGAGIGLGGAMASVIGQSIQGLAAGGASQPAAAPATMGLADSFAALKQLVAQQITLSAADKAEVAAGLDAVLTQLTSSTATLDQVKSARQALTSRFPWLAQALNDALSTPAALQALGAISSRSV
jgi:membrane protease subunit (stomatin/prohibitin family)